MNSSSRGFGFTVLELLVCIAIIAVVAAIVTPALVRVKKLAQVQSSMSNLHQLYLAGKMYQTDWDGDGKYGDIYVMGLPRADWSSFTLLDLGGRPAKSPCGLNPSWTEGSDAIHHYVYRPGDGSKEWWTDYVVRWQENALFFADVNCDDHSIPIYDVEFAHRGLGVLLSGQAVNHLKKGLVLGDNWWWSTPP